MCYLPMAKRPRSISYRARMISTTKNALLMIAEQARYHKISDAFDHMQKRMGQVIRSADGAYDQVVIDCAPGLSQLVWGALRTADLVLIPYIPDRTAEDNVGWLGPAVERDGAYELAHHRQPRIWPGQSRAGHHLRDRREVSRAWGSGSRYATSCNSARLPGSTWLPGVQIRLCSTACKCPCRCRPQCGSINQSWRAAE